MTILRNAISLILAIVMFPVWWGIKYEDWHIKQLGGKPNPYDWAWEYLVPSVIWYLIVIIVISVSLS